MLQVTDIATGLRENDGHLRHMHEFAILTRVQTSASPVSLQARASVSLTLRNSTREHRQADFAERSSVQACGFRASLATHGLYGSELTECEQAVAAEDPNPDLPVKAQGMLALSSFRSANHSESVFTADSTQTSAQGTPRRFLLRCDPSHCRCKRRARVTTRRPSRLCPRIANTFPSPPLRKRHLSLYQRCGLRNCHGGRRVEGSQNHSIARVRFPVSNCRTRIAKHILIHSPKRDPRCLGQRRPCLHAEPLPAQTLSAQDAVYSGRQKGVLLRHCSRYTFT